MEAYHQERDSVKLFNMIDSIEAGNVSNHDKNLDYYIRDTLHFVVENDLPTPDLVKPNITRKRLMTKWRYRYLVSLEDTLNNPEGMAVATMERCFRIDSFNIVYDNGDVYPYTVTGDSILIKKSDSLHIYRYKFYPTLIHYTSHFVSWGIRPSDEQEFYQLCRQYKEEYNKRLLINESI